VISGCSRKTEPIAANASRDDTCADLDAARDLALEIGTISREICMRERRGPRERGVHAPRKGAGKRRKSVSSTQAIGPAR
jgi:hypothetical protein